MAMKKELEPGTILYRFIHYVRYRPGYSGYEMQRNLDVLTRLGYHDLASFYKGSIPIVMEIQVDNRRARTNGIDMPLCFKPLGDLLGIRVQKPQSHSRYHTWVGCRVNIIRPPSDLSSLYYSNISQQDEFAYYFQAFLEKFSNYRKQVEKAIEEPVSPVIQKYLKKDLNVIWRNVEKYLEGYTYASYQMEGMYFSTRYEKNNYSEGVQIELPDLISPEKTLTLSVESDLAFPEEPDDDFVYADIEF